MCPCAIHAEIQGPADALQNSATKRIGLTSQSYSGESFQRPKFHLKAVAEIVVVCRIYTSGFVSNPHWIYTKYEHARLERRLRGGSGVRASAVLAVLRNELGSDAEKPRDLTTDADRQRTREPFFLGKPALSEKKTSSKGGTSPLCLLISSLRAKGDLLISTAL